MISKTAFSKRLSPLLSLAAFAAIADVSSADAATDETDPFYAEIETSLATGYSLPQTRAPAIATVIHHMTPRPGQPSAASTAPT